MMGCCALVVVQRCGRNRCSRRPGPRPAPGRAGHSQLSILTCASKYMQKLLARALVCNPEGLWGPARDPAPGLTQGLRRQVVSPVSVFDVRPPLAGSRNRYPVWPEIAKVSALSDLEGTQQAGPPVSPSEPRTPGGSGLRARGGPSSAESANPPLAV